MQGQDAGGAATVLFDPPGEGERLSRPSLSHVLLGCEHWINGKSILLPEEETPTPWGVLSSAK